jgi:hypothetical protein
MIQDSSRARRFEVETSMADEPTRSENKCGANDEERKTYFAGHAPRSRRTETICPM